MPDDVLMNKIAAIERCLVRIEEEYKGHEGELETNLTKQDSILLNLQRASETAIDLAMHMVRVRRLGLPQESREAFTLVQRAGLVDEMTTKRMQAMVGFRNVAVHTYQEIDLAIVRNVVEHCPGDFSAFTSQLLQAEVVDDNSSDPGMP